MVLVVATLGMPANTDVVPEMLGRLFAYVLIPALVAGFFARRSAKSWSMWKIVGVYVLVLLIVVAAGLASNLQNRV
jgi:hypothetical protein